MEENMKLGGTENVPEKMSYEQLENIAHQLSEQSKQLYSKLQEMNMSNIFKRLEFLFKVLENAPLFREEFLNNCIKEVEELITIPVEEQSEETENKK